MYNSFLEYPFGSPMSGRSFSASSYKYGFNGKEKDDEIGTNGGSYDFGARIFDSRLGRWYAVDPLVRKYKDLSPYNYAANNPIVLIDPNGKEIIFVNGYIGFGSNPGGEKYWQSGNAEHKNDFIDNAKRVLNDSRTTFVDPKSKMLSTPKERINAGKAWAAEYFTPEKLKQYEESGETLKLVTHSHGAAFSEGIIEYINANKLNIKVETVVSLSPHGVSGFDYPNDANNETTIVQTTAKKDPVSRKAGKGKAAGNTDAVTVSSSKVGIRYRHAYTLSPSVWNVIETLIKDVKANKSEKPAVPKEEKAGEKTK